MPLVFTQEDFLVCEFFYFSLFRYSEQRLDFCQHSDPDHLFHSCSVAAQSPGSICSAKPSLLLYINTAVFPREIRQLNCSTFPPTATEVVTRTGQSIICDLCCINREGETLVIITSCKIGISAYKFGKDCLEWNVSSVPNSDCDQKKIDARGITAVDDRYLAVCDYNNECIQMISKPGRYLGAAYKFRNRGCPDMIEWCSDTSCLFVTCQLGDSWSIQIIKVA